ncbi:YkvA family protein [Kiloniella sp. EL199]|uniref:YkvA family protein n=1 Tax=Kiloniella sp. EL199 TaxID=2107581 RepID=UPI000EA2D128|nr:YkvA family protein [Kiloniella sp. EL199]
MRFIQLRKPNPENSEPTLLAADEKIVKKGFLRKLKKVALKITFSERLMAAYFCATDRKTPLKVKAILMAALAYFVVPVDLVPDFIIAFGFADDISVLIAAINAVKKHITEEHIEKAQVWLDAND